MKYTLQNEKELLTPAIEQLNGQFGMQFCDDGVPVFVKIEGESTVLSFQNGALNISADCLVRVFWALKYFSDNFTKLPEDGYHYEVKAQMSELTYMLDCSRNAVYHVSTVKELVRMLAVMGYNSFMLYTEDTFVVESYPYFGYLRNPYTKQDIEQIDDYCAMFGIELIPCIQTLAHFNSLTRHYAMVDLFDFNDILMVGEEETYRFVEKLISTCRKYFKSKRIHIGMDEAYMLGRGKYLDKNGYRKRFDIMTEHLQKVVEICKKYKFEPMMWSDMFFSLTINAQYGVKLSKELASKIPQDVELIYWDYCSTSKSHYNQMMKKHMVFENKIGFAGGAWKWLGYTPDNAYSFASLTAAAKACKQNGIKHFIVTGWGDNGADCSCFANLPSLLYASQLNFDNYKAKTELKRSFASLSGGMGLSDFMAIDLANRVTTHNNVEEKNSANKYLLFNDVLLGTLDTTVVEGLGKLYGKHAKRLANASMRSGKWKYIFKTQQLLCGVLEIKADIGIKLRNAYQQGDKQALKRYLKDLKKLLTRIESFYRALRIQWDTEARPNGFDVQDIRIGALKQRVHVAIDKITLYLQGKTDSIPELEEKLLDFMGHGTEFEKDFDQCEWRWRRMTSVNVNE